MLHECIPIWTYTQGFHTLCIERTAMRMAVLRDAKRTNRTIIIAWIDRVNSYVSVRHSLIHCALSLFHAPYWVCSLVKLYYNELFANVVTRMNELRTLQYTYRCNIKETAEGTAHFDGSLSHHARTTLEYVLININSPPPHPHTQVHPVYKYR